MPFITFLGVYAAAVIAGIISHVPGGVGVFEAVVLLTVPNVPPEAMLGSLLAYRAIYYLAPLVLGTLLFGGKELAAQGARLAWAQQLASAVHRPGRAADRRRPHLPRRRAAAVLRGDAGGG